VPVQDWTRLVSDLFLDRRRSVRCVFDKLCMRHRAIKGRATVWQIAKRCACVHRPLLSVGLIAQQRRGSVWWGGWAGHEPTARTNCRRRLPDAQRPLVLSPSIPQWQRRYGGDQREPPTQVSTAMSAVPFDRRRTVTRWMPPATSDCRSPCHRVTRQQWRRQRSKGAIAAADACPWRCRPRRVMTSDHTVRIL